MADDSTSPFGESDIVEVTEAVPAAPIPPEPKKKRIKITTSDVGKSLAIANLIIATLFSTIAVFFRANKIQVDAKKADLEKVTRELTQLEMQRKQIVDGLNQEIEAEKQRLAALGQQHQKELGDLETTVKQTKDRIESARKEQATLNAEAATHDKEQEELIVEIQRLRGVYEDTRSDEEALTADRTILEDLLAKVQNNLAEAVERSKQVESELAKIERPSSP